MNCVINKTLNHGQRQFYIILLVFMCSNPHLFDCDGLLQVSNIPYLPTTQCTKHLLYVIRAALCDPPMHFILLTFY